MKRKERKERTEFRIGLRRGFERWVGQTCYGEVSFCCRTTELINPQLRDAYAATLTVTTKPRPGFLPIILRHPKVSMWWRWSIPNITDNANMTDNENVFGHMEYVTSAIVCRLKRKSLDRLPKAGTTLWFKLV